MEPQARQPARRAMIMAAAITGLLFPAFAAQAAPERLQVTTKPIDLYEARPADKKAGKLRYVSGLELKSNHTAFGGISGLVIAKDGQRFIAITDRGAYLKGVMRERTPGQVSGVIGVKTDQLNGLNGPLTDKRSGDAESIIDLSNGALTGPFVISFEGKHRALHYKRLDAVADSALPLPPKGPYIPSNSGLEALVQLQDGRIMGLTEDADDANGNRAGWIADGIAARPIALKPNGKFKPTDMARLPNGDVLILERSFDRFSGPGMQIRRIAASSITESAVLDGPVLVKLNRSANIDNMEAMDVRTTDDGRTLIYIMSDDNFNMIQRTLLLVFELAD